jgi:N-methylhydantoinase B
VVLRGSDILEILEKGVIPNSVGEIRASGTEVLPAKAMIQLEAGDMAATMEAGGGGYGDPLKRDPTLVRRDVLGGLVSREVAESVYGVVFQDDGATVDAAATARRREAILAEPGEKAGPGKRHEEMAG